MAVMDKAGGLELRGFKEFDRLIKELPDRVGGAVMRKVIRAGGRPLAKAYKSNLKRHKIHGSWVGLKVKRYKRSSVTMGIVGLKRPAGRVAHLIEFGTAPRYHKKSGKYVGAMPAYRPLTRAQHATRHAMVSAMRKKAAVEIKKEAMKLGKK